MARRPAGSCDTPRRPGSVAQITSYGEGMPSGLALLLIVAMGVVVLAGGIMRVYHPVTEGGARRRERRRVVDGGDARVTRRALAGRHVRRARARSATITLLLDPAVDAHLDHGIDPFIGAAEDHALRARREREARVAAQVEATRRRRRAAGAMILMSLIAGLLAGAGVLPLVAVPVPMLLLAAVLAAGRAHVRRRARRAERAETNGQSQQTAHDGSVDEETRVAHVAATAAPNVHLLDGERVPGRLRTSGVSGREDEVRRALAATYADAEEELGLDDYVGGIDAPVRYLRAVGE